MALVFDVNLKVITVEKTQTTLTIQDLYDEIRLFEETMPYLFVAQIANGSGKQSLGGGVTVGITLELINDWRLSFEARDGIEEGGGTILCTVSGGNLVATNIYSNNPIKPTAYTQVVISQSSSATVIAPPSDVNLLYLVESLRGTHASIGNVFYWDPTGGSDSSDGTTPTNAVLTFAQAQTLTTAGNNDVIFALSTAAGGVTTITETITITVPTLKLRGPGYQFQFVPGTGGSADTITISADSVEVSGFYITTGTEATYDGISISAGSDNTLIKDCWITTATGNGIILPGGSLTTRTTIDTCAIEDCTGDGINIGDYTTRAKIKQCILSGNTNGASISGSNSRDNIFENNLIYNNSAYGITIGSGVTRTGIRSGHTFANNTSGSTYDDPGAINTFIETGGAVTPDDRALIAVEVADAVWDEVISSAYHAGANSAGKTLRDAKTRATLASLK